MDMLAIRISELLNRLGLTANYAGYRQLAYALWLCAEQQDRLLFITKQIYPDVAKQFHTTQWAVERNCRTVADIIWRENKTQLEELVHRPLQKKPTNAQLLAILSASLTQYSFL